MRPLEFVFHLLAASFVTSVATAQNGTAVALRADLAQFRSEFMAVDRSYSSAARGQAEARIAGLESSLESMTRAKFELEIARIVALADNGHTNAAANLRSARHNRVPLRLVLLGDGYYVLRARAPHTDLLGARLVAIGTRPVAELRDAARALIGGTEAYRDRSAPFVFESPQLLHALNLATDTVGAMFRLALPNGTTVERRVVADPPDQTRARVNPNRWMFPTPEVNDGPEWRSLLAPEQAPWALQEVNTPFRWKHLPEIDAVVIELRQNRGTQTHPIETFMSEVESQIAPLRAKHLVLDMRMNGGGNLQLTRDFARKLPTLVSGRIFALTSPWTFSAAISTVGYLEQAAPERVTIVGEMVGDRLEFWAEGGPVTLRQTGVLIGRSLERHDYATGCRPYSDCHRAVVEHPISVRTLAPDIAAPWTIETYRAGRDPAMEAVAGALR
jgi:hypothetical protein